MQWVMTLSFLALILVGGAICTALNVMEIRDLWVRGKTGLALGRESDGGVSIRNALATYDIQTQLATAGKNYGLIQRAVINPIDDGLQSAMKVPLLDTPAALLHTAIGTSLQLLYVIGYGRLGIVPFKDDLIQPGPILFAVMVVGLALVLSLLARPGVLLVAVIVLAMLRMASPLYGPPPTGADLFALLALVGLGSLGQMAIARWRRSRLQTA